MALPGLFIEYLVIGALALLWGLPLTGIDIGGEALVVVKIAALAPAVYVLGMFLDFAAFALVTWFPFQNGSYKNRVRRNVERKTDIINNDDSRQLPDGSSAKSLLASRQRLRDYLKVFWGGFAELNSKVNEHAGATARRQIRLFMEMPDIARQVEMRSSRDRIARGSVLNLALIGFVHFPSSPILACASLLLAITAIPMWVFFEGNSYGYELRALNELKETDSDG